LIFDPKPASYQIKFSKLIDQKISTSLQVNVNEKERPKKNPQDSSSVQ
jgi:hypothetical protein